MPLCLLLALVKFLFGGSGRRDGGVVYYSSSVYQSTTYSRDGNVETTRKEDFRSNVPGLAERAREYSQEQSRDNANYFGSVEKELQELEDAFGSPLFQKW